MAIIDGEITIQSYDLGQSVTFAPKAELTYDLDSLATSDSGRDDSGMMHIDFILTRARKLNIVLPPMTGQAVNKILDMVQGRIYWITYRDPITNASKRSLAYTSKSKATLYSGVIRGGIWQDCSFNAIEMKGETS